MTNNTTSLADDGLAFQLSAAVVIGFFIVLCILLTIFGNSIVVMAFIKEKSLRNFSDYLILNLAVSDLIIGCVSIPFYTPYVLTKKWPFGHTFCIIWLLVDYITPAASALNIGIISLDRYILVARPFWARKHRSSGMLAIFLITPWALPAIYFIPAICLWEVTHGRVLPDDQCYLPYQGDITVLLIGATIEFVLPFVTVLVLNLLVYICIRQRTKRFMNMVNARPIAHNNEHLDEHDTAHEDVHIISKNNQTSHQNETTGQNSRIMVKSNINKDKKAARSLFIFVLVFAVCWMPYEILATASTICGPCINAILYEFTFWILWVNSTINPVLYPILHSRYRRAFSTLLRVKHNRILPIGRETRTNLS